MTGITGTARSVAARRVLERADDLSRWTLGLPSQERCWCRGMHHQVGCVAIDARRGRVTADLVRWSAVAAVTAAALRVAVRRR